MIKIYKGQRYEWRGLRTVPKADGSFVSVNRWTSHCAECGEPFECATSTTAFGVTPSRRCEEHKAPGHPVK